MTNTSSADVTMAAQPPDCHVITLGDNRFFLNSGYNAETIKAYRFYCYYGVGGSHSAHQVKASSQWSDPINLTYTLLPFLLFSLTYLHIYQHCFAC